LNKLKVIDLGLIEYQEAKKIQEEIVYRRLAGEIPDTLILCEHTPVITMGRKGKRKDILVPEEFLVQRGIKVYSVERGGETTYHSPGQIVGYPVFDLHSYGLDLHRFLRNIEEVIILSLSEIGIEGKRREGYTGVWIANRLELEKIAFIGISARRWITFHGFSLNIDCDLSPFSWIVPCGLKGVRVSSVKKILNGYASQDLTVESIKPKIIENFRRVFGMEL